MSNKNLYHILEIPDYSDISVVKKAFRQMALKYHPDRNKDQGVVEKFKEVISAYDILKNSELKQRYDDRLKFGYDYVSKPYVAPESDFETKRKRYAKMKKEQDEMEQIENITSYEASISRFPFHFRLILLGLLLITGIFYVVSDWYIKGNKIAFGFFMIIGSALFLWNEFYKYYWHKSLTNDDKRYDRQAMYTFITIFIIGISTTFGLIKIKKAWHLAHFGKVIYAGINHEQTSISYTYNDYLHVIDIYEIPPRLMFKNMVLIKISTKEPEIWEFFEPDE